MEQELHRVQRCIANQQLAAQTQKPEVTVALQEAEVLHHPARIRRRQEKVQVLRVVVQATAIPVAAQAEVPVHLVVAALAAHEVAEVAAIVVAAADRLTPLF